MFGIFKLLYTKVLICAREARRPFTYIIFNHPNFQYREYCPHFRDVQKDKSMTHTNIRIKYRNTSDVLFNSSINEATSKMVKLVKIKYFEKLLFIGILGKKKEYTYDRITTLDT